MASDFFKVTANQSTLTPHKALSMKGSMESYHTLSSKFDVVITNPPYTRQDDIGDKKYVDFIRQVALNINDKDIKLSSEAGIYTYFFTHSYHFLKEDGFIGYIVSNSWMDVKFGKDLQKFFLDNFKIKCIIDFDKRSFEEAAVNTVIIILQKTSNKTNKIRRDANKVKFVRIKKRLAVDKLVKLIDIANETYEDDEMRCVVVNQKSLYDDYKWSIYLRAPEIYYKIIKSKKLTELHEVADVSAGIVTLANDFYILSKDQAKKLGIEQRFLRQSITKSNKMQFLDLRSADSDGYILSVNARLSELQDTNVIKYIRYNEAKDIEITRGATKGKVVKGYQNTPAILASKRNPWYSLGDIKAESIIVPVLICDRWYAAWNKDGIYVNDTFYYIEPKKKENLFVLLGLLNSTLTEFFAELYGKTVYGEGVIQLRKHIFDRLLVLNPDALSTKIKDKIKELFMQLCDAKRKEDIKLEQKIREELDNIVFDVFDISEMQVKITNALKEMRSLRKTKVEAKVLIEE
jgi:type I restriction-modification system DNA methylase subunit